MLYAVPPEILSLVTVILKLSANVEPDLLVKLTPCCLRCSQNRELSPETFWIVLSEKAMVFVSEIESPVEDHYYDLTWWLVRRKEIDGRNFKFVKDIKILLR